MKSIHFKIIERTYISTKCWMEYTHMDIYGPIQWTYWESNVKSIYKVTELYRLYKFFPLYRTTYLSKLPDKSSYLEYIYTRICFRYKCKQLLYDKTVKKLLQRCYENCSRTWWGLSNGPNCMLKCIFWQFSVGGRWRSFTSLMSLSI